MIFIVLSSRVLIIKKKTKFLLFLSAAVWMWKIRYLELLAINYNSQEICGFGKLSLCCVVVIKFNTTTLIKF